MNIKKNTDFHREVQVDSGSVHVFANETVFEQIEPKAFESADNNLRIPRNVFMSYTPDVHVGVGTCIGTTAVWRMDNGFVSPSIVGSDIGCGMRVHTTTLHKDDLKDKDLKRKIVGAIEKYMPTNERVNSNYVDIDIEQVAKNGILGLPLKYIPEGSYEGRSVTHVENAKFDFDHKYLEEIPQNIYEKSKGQLGNIGSGNHFLEIQYLEIDENEKERAEKWGLFDGQVIIMIHSGSRNYGAMLGRSYEKEIKNTMEAWGISNPDPKLIYAPIHSEEGKRYLNLMYSALNFAVANRHMLAFAARQGFKDIFGEDFEMPVLYDLMHNYALKEYHRKQTMLVHRKGATRALPAGHFLNPASYKETGHPALIPGSMGTSSYIMVGQDAGAKNFHSICHGAGRVRSRSATKKLVTVDQFSQSLRVGEEDEIIVNHQSLEAILDECPQAYKDVDQIIDSVVGAGLASVVAKCKPMIGIKGV